MSVSSKAVFYFSNEKQLEAIKNFKFRFTGLHQEKTEFCDIAKINPRSRTCEMTNCFCFEDFEECLNDFAEFIANTAKGSRFEGYGVWVNETSGETYELEARYDGAGDLEVDFDEVDPETLECEPEDEDNPDFSEEDE